MGEGIKFTLNGDSISLGGINNSQYYYHGGLTSYHTEIKIRTSQGVQVTLKYGEIYICGDNDKITHIKRKGDKTFKPYL